MPNTFLPAPELADMAAPLIEEHHPNLAEHGVRVEFVWRTEAVKRGDLIDFGKASKVSGLNAFLAREDEGEYELVAVAPPKGFFVIQIWQMGWTQLNEAQRNRVLDHLLCYLSAEEISEKGGEVRVSLSLRSPEVVEFQEIYSRHKPDDLTSLAVKLCQSQQAEKDAAKKAAKKKANPASETDAVIGANGKPRKKKREKKDYPEPKAGVSKEQRQVGGKTFTLAVTPDGTEFQFMIAVKDSDGEDRICVAGRRAESVNAAKIFFDEWLTEHEVEAAS